MARVHFVKKARKDNPAVKRGESYYWWAFAFGPKRYSRTAPRRSQLTQSSFLSQLYDLEDGLHKRFSGIELATDALQDEISNLTSDLESLRDECQDSLDNMPEHLQDTSDSGILLTERVEGLDEWISELESIDADGLNDDELDETMKEELLQDIVNDIENANPGL